ncbi:MAG: LuxR family transcriptional regulator [Thermoleophilia bacterium]|nr:LuxR family transcriptional regulator [Thermoleophilia bacterium]
MIDSHTHLDSAAPGDDWVGRAVTSGVQGMVSIGCGAESIRATLEIARANPDHVRVAAGVHPLSAAKFDVADFPEIAELARDPLVVAIGETGFDQYHDAGTLEQQMPAFELQCALARELDLPLVIHSRAAEEHTIRALDEFAADLTVILHCFALAQPEHVDTVLDHANWICSFAGNLTYPSAQSLRDAAARIPLDRLMVETDAPYLSPKPYRGKPNEPAYVQHTLQVLADTLGLTFEQARTGTVATARRVFDWTPTGVTSAVVA